MQRAAWWRTGAWSVMACATLALAGGALDACGDPPPAAEAEWAFSPPVVVWLRSDGSVRAAFLVDVGAGRSFVVATAAGPDGRDTVFFIERTGIQWSAPVFQVRPAGVTRETVQWVTHDPYPTVLTVAEGPAGSAVYLRRRVADEWGPPEPVTQLGLEGVGSARAALGGAEPDGSRRVHVVYSDNRVRGGTCAEGLTLRHRVRTAAGWSQSRIVAQPCAVTSMALAASEGRDDALMVVFAGVGASPIPGSTQSVYGVPAFRGVPAEFQQPFRIVGGTNSDVQVVAQPQGRFVATWRYTRLEAGGQGRAAVTVYEPTTQQWEVPNLGWFFTAPSPFPTAMPGGGVVALGGEQDAPGGRLSAWRWASAAVPVLTRSAVAIPTGTPGSLRLVPFADGSLQALWLESQGGVGLQRVMWASGLPRGLALDAGR